MKSIVYYFDKYVQNDMVKNFTVLLIMFLAPIFSIGNLAQQDSLLNILANENEINKISILEELSKIPDISIEQRVQYLKQAIGIAEDINNPMAKANTLYELGIAYENKGNFEDALVVCQESLALFNANNKLFESTKVLTLIGAVYIYLENFDMAINHFKKALEIRYKLGDQIQIANALTNLGNVAGITGKLDEAMEYYGKALKIREEFHDLKGLSQLYNNIANIHFAKGEMSKVLPYRLKALQMDRESGDKWQIALKTYNLAEYYLVNKEPQKAYPYIIESKKLAESLENYGLINDNIQFLSSYYELLNDNKKALEYQKLYAKSTKETFSKELSEQVSEMEVKYETEKKERETQEIMHQLDRVHSQRLILLCIVIIGFLIIVFIISLFYKKKKNNQFLETEVLKRTNELRIKNSELERNGIELMNAKVKAEESDRLKSAFLTNMSHEIRTPMNSILGFTNLLIDPNLSESDKELFADNIQSGSDRLLNTIDNIIEASRIEASQLKSSNSNFCINKLIEEIYNRFNSDNTNTRIEFSFSNGLPKAESSIFSDKSKISVILTNLIKNAFKFTKEGAINFGYRKKDNFLEFYVVDTGVGVPIERQDAIFNLFVQSDIEDRNAYQGSGLGLFIAKSYVELLGGRIWIKSNLETGSSFYFTIPCQYDQSEESGLVSGVNDVSLKDSSAELKILIVEDDMNSDVYLTAIVGNLTKHILHASDGMEAVNICQQQMDIDLILMDLKMPVMNGIDAIKKIREFNKDVYIIAQTAYALVGDRENAIQAGCNDYVSKPVKKDELLAKIAKYSNKIKRTTDSD